METHPDDNPDDNFKFSIEYLLNENDKKINIEEIFNISEWTKFLIDNYCIIPNNINFEKEIYTSNMSYTQKQKEYNTSCILNIFCHLKFKKLYITFWNNAVDNLAHPNKFIKVCKNFINKFKLIISTFLINHSKANDSPLNLDFINSILLHLDSVSFYQNIRKFIIKVQDFINLSKTKNENTHLDIISRNKEDDKIYNLVKCAITCYVFQSIINQVIPDISISSNPEVIFFIASCYSIVDGLIDNTNTASEDTRKKELQLILKYIENKMNDIQNIFFTPDLNKKKLTQLLLEYSKDLKIINTDNYINNINNNTNYTDNNILVIKQINYIIDNIIDFFINITLNSDTGNNNFKLCLEVLQKYINIIQYNFKLEIHCYTFQTNWKYCSKYQNAFGLTICKGISMGYLSCLQEDIYQFDKIWNLSLKWCPNYDSNLEGFDVIPSIGIFQLFSLLIQILDDLGDYKSDKKSGIITSVIFPIFSNYIINPSLKLEDIGENIFKKYINSSYVVLFIFFYHITKINNNKKHLQNYLRMIMTIFHQFYYYSITKNEDLIGVSILEKMNINKYYLLEHKTIIKLRNMKNNNKNKLIKLFSRN